MKRVFTMLLTAIIIISQFGVISVFADTAVGTTADNPLGMGDSVVLKASDYTTSISKKFNGGTSTRYGGTINDLTTAEYGKVAANGNTTFRFYSEKAQTVKLTLTCAPWTASETRNVLAFFNPAAIALDFDENTLVSDYPAMADALVNFNFVSYTDYATCHGNSASNRLSSNPADWIKKVYYVEAKEGVNLLWFPSTTLIYSEAVTTGEGESATTTYTTHNMYTGTDGTTANANVMVYSLDVEVPEENGSVTYAKDLDTYGTRSTLFSYTGDDAGKVTAPQNYEGVFSRFPFTTNQTGDYVLRVYYSAAIGQYSPASVYIDLGVTAEPSSVFSTSVNSSDTTADEYLPLLNEKYDTEYTAYPNSPTKRWWKTWCMYLNDGYVEGTTKRIISDVKWQPTGPTYDLINNEADTEVNRKSHPSYFKMKTFYIDDLKAGSHTATFIVEREDMDGDGNFCNDAVDKKYNNQVMINRIEVVPVVDDLKLDCNTFVYNIASVTTGDSKTVTCYNYLYTVEEAKSMKANGGSDITFGLEVTNNTSAAKNLLPIFAGYDEDGNLAYCDVREAKTVGPNKANVNTYSYTIDPSSLPDKVVSLKMLVVDNLSSVSPICATTDLE